MQRIVTEAEVDFVCRHTERHEEVDCSVRRVFSEPATACDIINDENRETN